MGRVGLFCLVGAVRRFGQSWDVQRRRVLAAVICALFVVGVAGVLIWSRWSEPRYRGKSLSTWLGYYDRRARDSFTPEELEEADAAWRHIGTNAVPWLVKAIQYQPGIGRARL